MIQKMQDCQVLVGSETTNAHREQVVTYAVDRTIQMAISGRETSTIIQNSIKTVRSSHVGITADRNITEQDRILADGHEYAVDGVNSKHRIYAICYLTEDRGIERNH